MLSKHRVFFVESSYPAAVRGPPSCKDFPAQARAWWSCALRLHPLCDKDAGTEKRMLEQAQRAGRLQAMKELQKNDPSSYEMILRKFSEDVPGDRSR